MKAFKLFKETKGDVITNVSDIYHMVESKIENNNSAYYQIALDHDDKT